MDTEVLHDQLHEIAATSSIDASADRGAIESRARRYRRHRCVGSAFVALALAAVVVVLVVLTTGGDSSQSVHLPPAQSSDGFTPGERDSAAPWSPDTVADCVARENTMKQAMGSAAPPPGMMAIHDRGTLRSVLMPIRDYCVAAIRLTPPRTDPNDLSTVELYLENGVVKAVPGLPLTVITDPDPARNPIRTAP